MKRLFILFTIASCAALSAMGWSQKGHDVTAYIAEQHLTPTTAAAVDSILEGRSIVYWSNWLDNASYQSELRYTKTWHYKNIDAEVAYEDAPLNPDGDIVTALQAMTARLSAGDTVAINDSRIALRIVIHLMGDLHMPLHLGHASDRGGNEIKGKFFDREVKLHSAWDSNLPEAAHKWSYTEWQQQIDRPATYDADAIIAGDFDTWARESVEIASRVYLYFRPGFKISYNDIARWAPTIEQQFLRGGLRLAHVLNLIYDPEYRASHR